MKIKLISPKMTLRPMDSEFKRVLSPSISLLVLANLTPNEHEVYIEDENAQKINFNDEPDLVGINVNVDTSPGAYKIAERYRQKNIPVIFGGIHASAKPQEALQHGDAVCVGEAEPVWQQILNDVQKGCLKGIYYHDRPVDLAQMPLPRWDLIRKDKYLYTSIVCASRGCPYHCDFCYNSCDYMHNKHRNRPIENVIEEIRQLGTREVMFIDDNFIGNIPWTRDFVRAITPMKLRWHAAVSSNIGQHLDLLDAMKTSGCESLFIGFESISRQSIASVKKYQNKIEDYQQLIKEIHSRGMMINASMVFGFDHDHPNIFQDTLEWLVSNKIETITAHILTPYPGTKLYNQLEKEGRIVDHDGTHYNTSKVVYEPKNMTREELYQGYLWIYKQFYSFKNIIKRMPATRSQRLPFLLFNLVYRKYGKIACQLARLGFMNRLGRLARRLSYGID
ncbi:MAG: B12-binding domain-containing radical SAM protein [Phycisphaerae bacterium]|nr:B12-binding domain-containing radical SAM protein [Phycisphaerae bacterium]